MANWKRRGYRVSAGCARDATAVRLNIDGVGGRDKV